MLMSFNLLFPALLETLYMTFAASIIAGLIGLPLGFILFTTRKQGLLAEPTLNKILSFIINVLRSVPFIILLVAIIPFTRLVVGTTIGTTAAIVPLIVGSIPFIARIVEKALEEVPYGLTEAALSLGATPTQIMTKVLFPEALPGIIHGITLTVIAIISYSAMAGAVGGGGLGDLAIRYGYQRFDMTIMLETVVLLIILVQLIQMLGDSLASYFNRR